jgi:hypothetical protein
LEAESHRRRLELPVELIEPGPEWTSGYRQTAQNSRLDPELHGLQPALARTGACLNPLLSGALNVGTWNPAAGCWESAREDHQQRDD